MTTSTKQTFNTNNNKEKKDLEDFEVPEGATPEEIEELKEVKRINKEIDDLKLKEDTVIKIDVGNMTPEEIDIHVKEANQKLKNRNTLSDDEVKTILKKYSDGKDFNDLSLLELNEKITYLEYQNFDILRIINALKIKISELTQKEELIELKYKKDIYSVENKKLYSNQESRETALKELLSQDKDYNYIDDNIKKCKNTITDLEYKEQENNILKSNFKRIYDIKIKTLTVIDTDTNECFNPHKIIGPGTIPDNIHKKYGK